MLENVLLAVAAPIDAKVGLMRPMTAHRELFDRANAAVGRMGPDANARIMPVRQLSYGEQRQIELVLALAGAPKVLLLDEPTAGFRPPRRAASCTWCAACRAK